MKQTEETEGTKWLRTGVMVLLDCVFLAGLLYGLNVAKAQHKKEKEGKKPAIQKVYGELPA